jgi:hypothetical protein
VSAYEVNVHEVNVHEVSAYEVNVHEVNVHDLFFQSLNVHEVNAHVANAREVNVNDTRPCYSRQNPIQPLPIISDGNRTFLLTTDVTDCWVMFASNLQVSTVVLRSHELVVVALET